MEGATVGLMLWLWILCAPVLFLFLTSGTGRSSRAEPDTVRTPPRTATAEPVARP